MAANRTGTGKTEPESPKPNRLRFTTKPEKPETGETETAVYKKWYLGTDIKWVKWRRREVIPPPFESSRRDLKNGHGSGPGLFKGIGENWVLVSPVSIIFGFSGFQF